MFHAAAAPPPLFFASSSAFALSKFALHFSQQKNSSAQKHPRYRPMSNVGFAVNVNNAVAQQITQSRFTSYGCPKKLSFPSSGFIFSVGPRSGKTPLPTSAPRTAFGNTSRC